jgi:hypothetical protein
MTDNWVVLCAPGLFCVPMEAAPHTKWRHRKNRQLEPQSNVRQLPHADHEVSGILKLVWNFSYNNPNVIYFSCSRCDRLCGLVVKVPGYRSRGPGSIFSEVVGLERGSLSLVRIIEELF